VLRAAGKFKGDEAAMLPFDETGAAIFDDLRARKIRIGTNDLAIAAITLSVNGILVTRNAVDFQRVPDPVLENRARRVVAMFQHITSRNQ